MVRGASGFGIRISFGFRPSVFGFEGPEPGGTDLIRPGTRRARWRKCPPASPAPVPGGWAINLLAQCNQTGMGNVWYNGVGLGTGFGGLPDLVLFLPQKAGHTLRMPFGCPSDTLRSASQQVAAPASLRCLTGVGLGVASGHTCHGFARGPRLPPYQHRVACSAFFILPSAFTWRSGGGLVLVWGRPDVDRATIWYSAPYAISNLRDPEPVERT